MTERSKELQRIPLEVAKPSAGLIVVGIGASAGGAEALQAFFTALPEGGELAFVVVQHLDPAAGHLPAEVLGRCTTLPVLDIEHGMAVEAGHVYIAPPQTLVTLRGGVLQVGQAPRGQARRLPIDGFLQSLADDRQAGAVGIILSGTGSDGSLGLKAISDAGGMTMVQDSGSAKYTAMPGSAAALGVVDHVLAPERMPAELLAYARHLRQLADEQDYKALHEQIAEALPAICEVLEKATQHDFRHYKTSTLIRRIQRRMQVLRLTRVEEYRERLHQDPEEASLLFRELLIGVTAFFRDPEAFAALAREVIPRLVESRSPEDPVRIWVPGCASGEEAYSIAMLMRERLEGMSVAPTVQIFATDIDQRALAIARQGAYPLGIADELSGERLARFFIKKGNRYHVGRELRELCLFSAHSLINDPPFSRLDLISCRNLLIYLGPDLQKKLIAVFHYALRPEGYLFLGPSENITAHKDLFQPVDIRHRISQRKALAIRPAAPAPAAAGPRTAGQPETSAALEPPDIYQVAQRILLDEFAPRYAVVTEEGQIVCVSEGTGKYLEAPPGLFQNHIVRLARRGLRVGLRSALSEAVKTCRKAVREDLSLKLESGLQRVRLIVQPMPQLGAEAGLFMVVFQDSGPVLDREAAPVQVTQDQTNALIEQLERELNSTREDLEKAIQDLEVSNEELKSSNEELLSMNEELQSANEELETSKEEIQAANQALARANSDLENLLASTRIATLFLDDDLNIQSFTPAATALYNLMPGDPGRPLAHITHRARHMPPLPEPAALRERAEAVEDDLQTLEGRWYRRRVLPYRTRQGWQTGMVVTFIDITELRRSEQLARQRLAEIENLYHTAPIGLCFLDRERRFVRINEHLAELNGLPAQDHLGRTVREMVPALAEQLEPLLDRVIASGEPVLDLEIRGETAARPGAERVWLESYYPLKDPAGEVLGVSIVVQEVTAQKRAEARLRATRDQLAAVISSMDQGLIVVDPQGTILDMNPAALKIHGFAPGGHVFRHIDEFYAASQALDLATGRRLAAEERPLWRAMHGEVFSEFENEFQRIDTGQRYIVRCGGTPVRDASGRIVLALLTVSDITERKQAEQQLRESEAQFRQLADAIPQIVWRGDPAGAWDFVNRQWTDYTGTDLAAAAGWNWKGFLHPDDVARAEAALGALARGETGPMEYRLRGKDGGWRWFLARGLPIRDAEGRILRWFGTCTDIDEHKRLQESLEEAAHHKDQFLAMLAHELRNPLAPILNAVQIFELIPLHEPTLEQMREIIGRQVMHMVRLVDDLLDVSRIARGKIQLRRERMDLVSWLGKATHDHRGTLAAQGLTLAVTLPTEPAWIDADPTRITQVLGNLLQNAGKFTRPGGHVSVGLQVKPPWAIITVRDTGVGMDEATLRNLFQPFRQADRSLDRSAGGLGLGLALVKGLVELHDGEVGARSEGEGEGAEFTVRLPLLEELPPEGAERRAALAKPMHSVRMLVIEDSRDSAASIEMLLTLAGYQVVAVANDGESGLALARQWLPDVVICDIGLPGMDGYTVARALRREPALGSIFLVALTGYGDAQKQRLAKEAGFDLYLTKPLEMRLLEEALARRLGTE